MNELYFIRTNSKTIQVVWLEYGQLGEKYVLKTFEALEESPKTNQTSFITLKTIDGDLSMEYDN